MTFKNLHITSRDADILRLLNSLGACDSRSLRFLLAPETSLDTFSARLRLLQGRGYLRSFREEHAGKGVPTIYALPSDISGRKAVSEVMGLLARHFRFGDGHIQMRHTHAVNRLLCHVVNVLRGKNPSWKFSPADFTGQFEIHESVKTEASTHPLNPFSHPIPDGFLVFNNGVIAMEAELSQTYGNWKSKVSQWNQLAYHRDRPGCSKWLSPKRAGGNNLKRILFVSVPARKAERYAELSKPIEHVLGLKIIPDTNLFKP